MLRIGYIGVPGAGKTTTARAVAGSLRSQSKFKTIDEAEMALEIFSRRQRRSDEAADYIDEA